MKNGEKCFEIDGSASLVGDCTLCVYCGQDWLHLYKLRMSDVRFMICRECESVWLEGDDVLQRPKNFLDDLVEPRSDLLQWDQIEPL